MASPQIDQEWYTLLVKATTWVGTVLSATAAKISTDILMGRKLSFIGWMAVIIISVFWGWLAGLICAHRDVDGAQASAIISLAALLGEKLSIYITINYKEIFGRILSVITPKK